VIAPGLIPVKPGDRIKTDHRDAVKLADYFRSGLLTEVHPPSEQEEAVRDLCRGREDSRADLLRCRHRLGKMLLRRGILWEQGKKAWTEGHRRWLRTLVFGHEADKAVFEDYLLGIEQLEARLKSLDAKLDDLAQKEPYRQPVGWLRCLRGIDTLTAMTIVSELHDFRRFQSPRHLMGYLGLVPSEHSSGQQRHQGGITKAGNSHVRRILVEASWHYRHPIHIGQALLKRREGQPGKVIALADKALQRLHRRYWKLSMQGKPAGKVIIAVARELAGFIWAVLSPEALPQQAPKTRRTQALAGV
jgi:transposase